MASVYHLCCEAIHIKQKVVKKYSELAECDKKLYFSAVTIQKTWRGYVVRQMIKDWNKKAIIIQKYVRGWLARLHLPDRLKEYHYYLSTIYYNEQARKLQSLWRGYVVNISFDKELITLVIRKIVAMTRKAAYDVKALLRERFELDMINKEMQDRLREAFDKLRASAWNQTHHYIEEILKMLFERHHLLRTRQQEGIFSIHGSYELSCIEKILKSFPLTNYMKQLRELLHYDDMSPKPEQKKREFDLNTNITSKPYERLMLTQD